MKRRFVIIGLVAILAAVPIWGVSTIAARSNQEFMVVVTGRHSDGNWLAHHYGTDIQCLLLYSAHHHFELGQVINVHGHVRRSHPEPKLIVATRVEVNVPQSFPTGYDFDDSTTPLKTDPARVLRPPGQWIQLQGTILSRYGNDAHRYLFGCHDGATWILYLLPQTDLLPGDEFTAVGVRSGELDGFQELVVDSLEWAQTVDYTGDFPGLLIKTLDIVDWDPPNRIVIAIDGELPLSDYCISYEFHVDLDGETHVVYPHHHMRIRLHREGHQLLDMPLAHSGRNDLVRGVWSLVIFPTHRREDAAKFTLTPPGLD